MHTQQLPCLIIAHGMSLTDGMSSPIYDTSIQCKPPLSSICDFSDDLTLSNETAEQLIFRNHSSNFEQQVDVSQLIHVLHNEHLLSTDQIDNLTLEVVGNTNARKKQRLRLWIPQSTSNFIDPLIKCLRSTNHKPHLELADDLEADLWVPLSKQNCRYNGVTSPILTLCNMKEEYEGIYRCRVINSEGIYVLSEPSQVVLNKPNG